jgi:hypothetical protein
MLEQGATVRRRRLGAHGMIFRRRRVFAWLREGLTYDEIAAEEGVSVSRIRQIVYEELRNRAVDSGAEHAKLQLDRLAPAVQLGAEAIAAGDVSAITPYLKAIDRLDRYQTVASANQEYDDDARRKLMEKVNRLVANLRVGAKTIGESPAGGPGEAEGEGAGPASAPEAAGEANAVAASPPEAQPASGFLYLDRP